MKDWSASRPRISHPFTFPLVNVQPIFDYE